MFIKQPYPDGVGLKYVHRFFIFGREQLLQQRQLFIRGCRKLNKFELVAGLLLKAFFDVLAILFTTRGDGTFHAQGIGKSELACTRQRRGQNSESELFHDFLLCTEQGSEALRRRIQRDVRQIITILS
ncbi:hypothetical protein BN137_4284 [Cronobacter condimenti 1330]|uniref:Uncharacterized protein n=1 Tax=Cronobacter condimenti 1330 TaxID=1073999 RepID=K8A429_9ENTR|nr:hypothetical protein BN137_4284 [Cronobacter condimenti 1330]